MQLWNLADVDVRPQHPVVLHSEEGVARVVAIALRAGEALEDHEVHEHTWLHVHHGAVEVGGRTTATGGAIVHWPPQQRHSVKATEDALLVLVLAPWPGPGHPSTPEAIAARVGGAAAS